MYGATVLRTSKIVIAIRDRIMTLLRDLETVLSSWRM